MLLIGTRHCASGPRVSLARFGGRAIGNPWCLLAMARPLRHRG
jgi:hypothetical protein